MNAKDNITQIGGTAADLLRNMPGVLVDADGGITLINGRISGIVGLDRSAQLERIPGSSTFGTSFKDNVMENRFKND